MYTHALNVQQAWVWCVVQHATSSTPLYSKLMARLSAGPHHKGTQPGMCCHRARQALLGRLDSHGRPV
jgi:hypothetical protein